VDIGELALAERLTATRTGAGRRERPWTLDHTNGLEQRAGDVEAGSAEGLAEEWIWRRESRTKVGEVDGLAQGTGGAGLGPGGGGGWYFRKAGSFDRARR
jgi:hypothetical protein